MTLTKLLNSSFKADSPQSVRNKLTFFGIIEQTFVGYVLRFSRGEWSGEEKRGARAMTSKKWPTFGLVCVRAIYRTFEGENVLHFEVKPLVEVTQQNFTLVLRLESGTWKPANISSLLFFQS